MGVTVACVLRMGGEFKPEHVSRLYASVLKHWPEGRPRFVAFTDAPDAAALGGCDCCTAHRPEVRPLVHRWFKWWAKMEMFAPEHDDLGTVLYIDLDTIVVGDLTDLAAVAEMTLLRDFYRGERLQSGLMMLTPAARARTWVRWIEDPAKHARAHRGDGEFLHSIWNGRAKVWQDELPGQVVSYKVDVKSRGVPKDARVICFHGRPRPWDIPRLWKEDQ